MINFSLILIFLDTEISLPTEPDSAEGCYYISGIDTDNLNVKESPKGENSKIDFITRNSPSGKTNILHRTNNHQYARSTRVSIRNNSSQHSQNRSISPGNRMVHVKSSPNTKAPRANSLVVINGQNNSSTNLLGSTLKKFITTSPLPPSLETNFTPRNPDRYSNDLTPQVIFLQYLIN